MRKAPGCETWGFRFEDILHAHLSLSEIYFSAHIKLIREPIRQTTFAIFLPKPYLSFAPSNS